MCATCRHISSRFLVAPCSNYFVVLANVVFVPGASIIQVNATDDDVNQNALITYIIGRGGGDNFVIDSNTGVITLSPNADLAPDGNPPGSYNVTVRYVDRFVAVTTQHQRTLAERKINTEQCASENARF